MLYRELQLECKRLGLVATGNTKVLLQQLLGDSETAINVNAGETRVKILKKIVMLTPPCFLSFHSTEKATKQPTIPWGKSKAKIHMREMISLYLKHPYWTMKPSQIWASDEQL